jgi:large subunit ribosomal protein L21
VRRYIAVRARDQSQENTMYAVVTTGGKQYRVEAGSELTIERLAADAGTSVTFDRVLLVGDGETVTIGTPVVDGASVSATVLGEALGPKLVIFKFKQKVKYRRKTGHRQHMTRVRIDEISAAGKTSKAPKGEASQATDTAEATEAPKARRTRTSTTAKPATPKPATPKAATAKTATTTKRTTARKAAAKPEASATEATDEAAATADAPKPKRTRKPAASKAKATPEPETEE